MQKGILYTCFIFCVYEYDLIAVIFSEISGLESDGVEAGTDATFTCSYTTLTQTATAQWYKVVSGGEDSEVTGY